jgi:hypothetical protein
MPSLLDIAPAEISTKQVDVRGVPIDVVGLDAETWAALYREHPVLAKVVRGEPVEDRGTMVMAQAALIAAGTGHVQDKAHMGAALRLSAEEQTQLVSAIVDLSYASEIFVPLLGPAAEELLKAAAGARDGREQGTK